MGGDDARDGGSTIPEPLPLSEEQELELKIAELRLACDPEDPVLRRSALETRARWDRSSEAARTAEEMGAPRTIVLTAEIQALYRKAGRPSSHLVVGMASGI